MWFVINWRLICGYDVLELTILSFLRMNAGKLHGTQAARAATLMLGVRTQDHALPTPDNYIVICRTDSSTCDIAPKITLHLPFHSAFFVADTASGTVSRGMFARRATSLLTIPTSAPDLPSDGEGPPNRP